MEKGMHGSNPPRFLQIPAELPDAQYLRAALDIAADVMCMDPGTIDVHTKDTEGETAMHKASCWGDLRAVKVLLDAGSDIDALGDMDCTPLYFAVMLGFSDVADYLLEKGANPDARSEFGDTPRELAKEKGLRVAFPDAK